LARVEIEIGIVPRANDSPSAFWLAGETGSDIAATAAMTINFIAFLF
jgi:hypothetical protein